MIIVSSVSCIYGLGSPEAYDGMLLRLEVGQQIERRTILMKLVEIQYERNDQDFHRGTFRARGDVIEVFPAHETDRAVRIELFGDEIERMSLIDPLRGTRIDDLEKLAVYPASHYVTPKERIARGARLDPRRAPGTARPSCATRAGSSKRSGSSSARSSTSR